MTKAQMAERIAELEKEVEALKAGATVETHIHYHYPPVDPADPMKLTWPWIPTYPYTVTYSGDITDVQVNGGGI